MTDASDSRPKHVHLGTQVPPDVFAAITELAKDRRVNREHIMREAIALILEEHCLPVPPSLRHQLSNYKSSTRQTQNRKRGLASTMGDG